MKRDVHSTPAKNVDEYLLMLPEKYQLALEKIRQAIKSAAPKAEEVISYRIPTYKYNGALVHFAAFKNHCSFVVVNKNILKEFAKELEAFNPNPTGATIHFTPEHPIPVSLIKKIVKTRVKENQGRL